MSKLYQMVDPLEPDAGIAEHLLAARHYGVDFRRDRIGGKIVQGDIQCVDTVVPHVRDDTTQRRGDPRIARHDGAGQADLLDQRPGMKRPAAAERHRREPVGIVPAFDRYEADGTGHARVGDPDDGLRRLHHIQAQGFGDVSSDRVFCLFNIQTVQLAADRAFRVDPPHDDIGVRSPSDGRFPNP